MASRAGSVKFRLEAIFRGPCVLTPDAPPPQKRRHA
jgi:hypothetical protein